MLRALPMDSVEMRTSQLLLLLLLSTDSLETRRLWWSMHAGSTSRSMASISPWCSDLHTMPGDRLVDSSEPKKAPCASGVSQNAPSESKCVSERPSRYQALSPFDSSGRTTAGG